MSPLNLKRRALYAAMSIAVAWPCANVSAYNWPYKNATSNQQKIRHTVGAYRDANRFHNGIDIAPQDTSDQDVYSVEGGINTGSQPDGIRLGNIVYLHITVLPEFDDPANKNKFYPAGTLLGTLADSSGTRHIHFQEGPVLGPYVNPLNSISTFVDSTKPIVDSFKVFRQGPGDIEITNWILYGRIDFRAKGYDKMNPGMDTADNNGKVMPFKLGFKIHSYSSDAYALDKFTSDPTIQFNSAPDNQNVRLIHESVVNADPEYWITNTSVDGAVPANRWWNTKIKTGGDWDGEETGDGKANLESRFADGKYRVEILMGDNRGNVNDLNEGTSKKDFFIDNFRPYLERTEIKKSDGVTKYLHAWKLNPDGTALSKDGPAPNEALGDGTYKIYLRFSEDVVNPTLFIDGPNGPVPFALTPNPAGNQKNFSANLSVGTNSPIQDGLRTMTVNAVDSAGTALLALASAKTTINFSEFSRDNSSGLFPENAGPASVDFIGNFLIFPVV